MIEPLGWLDPYLTGTGFRIAPLVALIDPSFTLAINPHEVDEVFEAPFAFLMDPANHRLDEREWRGEMRKFYAMPHGRALYLGRHRRHAAQSVRETVLLMGRTLFEPLALFLSPFAAYAVYLVLRARYPLEVDHWTSGRVSVLTLLGLAAAVLGLVTLNLVAPRGHGTLRARARGERRAGAGADRMSRLPGLKDGRLRDLGRLTRGPLARALEALNGGGEETRLVGGAVRDLLLGLKRKTTISRRPRCRTR